MNTAIPVYADPASTLAVIALSNEPLVFLSEDLKVIATSASFCQTYGLRPAEVSGKLLSEIGNGEWNIPQLLSLLKATASGLAAVEMYECSLSRSGRPALQLIANAHRLTANDSEPVRLLLAVNDVTHAKAELAEKEGLIREKEVLLREIQHRVANSLQIIASVLMQSARRVQSDEARGHLRDAHSRVMSIATVQRLLSASTLDDVDLGIYLSQLCESLAASMIFRPDQLRIDVSADKTKMAAGQSVSLGLIVTELVINSLKHAFSENGNGTIVVKFVSQGTGWTLSVTDNGSGMPEIAEGKPPPVGLGTSIVQALAKQLNAEVRQTDNQPGTCVEIIRRPGAS